MKEDKGLRQTTNATVNSQISLIIQTFLMTILIWVIELVIAYTVLDFSNSNTIIALYLLMRGGGGFYILVYCGFMKKKVQPIWFPICLTLLFIAATILPKYI